MTPSKIAAGMAGITLVVTGCSSAASSSASSPATSDPAVASASSSMSASTSTSATASASVSPTPSESPSASDSATATPTVGGGGDLTSMKGQAVMMLVATALRHAGSARATGTMVGVAGAQGPVTAVFTADASQITMAFKGSTVSLITAPAGTYIKAPLALWTGQALPAKVAKVLAGHWVRVPATGSTSDTGLTIDGLAKDFEHPKNGHVIDPVTTGSYQGKPVAVVKQSSGSFIYVATDGSNLPVYLEKAGASGGKLTFSDFGNTHAIVIPKDIVDLSKALAG